MLPYPLRKTATDRLMRDWKEWCKNRHEFHCVDAIPLEDNLFEWHCNIVGTEGAFANIMIHVILKFSENYPIVAPQVSISPSIPHPNVFGGALCLDMLRHYEQGKFRGWTAAYSVESILMQLQSFLFETHNIGQDYGLSRANNISQNQYNSLLQQCQTSKCYKCGNCWDNPVPRPNCISDGSKDNERKNEIKNEINTINNSFAFWDGIYVDLECSIINFLSISDLMKLSRVAKRFKTIVKNSKIIEKASLKCWFYRASAIPNNDNLIECKDDGATDMTMLCLGYGIVPRFYSKQIRKIRTQLFAEYNNIYLNNIIKKIGNYPIIQSFETTFDLLSSNAFEKHNIRKTVFNDKKFNHFIPLYLSKKHGKLTMQCLKKYILQIYDINENSTFYHPWLGFYCVANIMKSLIVSVMNDCTDLNNNNGISQHYSINVLEAFFRYHHLLLSIYFENKNEIEPLLQHQICLYFNKKKKCNYRNKYNIPDFGVFCMYLSVWDNPQKLNLNDIILELLDETLTRQCKWVLNKYNHLINEQCHYDERIVCTWQGALVSRRLFMFQYFFLKNIIKLGSNNYNAFNKYIEYNDNLGFPKDDGLPFKLQNFVIKIFNKCSNYQDFFKLINMKYPGKEKLGGWLLSAMKQSEQRRYHKVEDYIKTPQMPPTPLVLPQMSLSHQIPQQMIQQMPQQMMIQMPLISNFNNNQMAIPTQMNTMNTMTMPLYNNYGQCVGSTPVLINNGFPNNMNNGYNYTHGIPMGYTYQRM